MTVNLYNGTNRICTALTMVLLLIWDHSTVDSTVQNSSMQYRTVQYSTVQYSTVQYSTIIPTPIGTMIPKRIYECSTMVPLHQTAIGLQSRVQSGWNHNRPFADRAFHTAFAIAIAIDDCGFRFPQTGVVCNRRLQSIPQSQNTDILHVPGLRTPDWISSV